MVATKERPRKRWLSKRKKAVLARLFAMCVVMLLFGFFIGRITKPVEVETVTETIYVPVTSNTMLVITGSNDVEVDESSYYDVPLSKSLQGFITTLCEEESIPVSLIYSMIETESQFDPDTISATGDYGLMQINTCNHEWLSELYDVKDFLDPYDNVFCGIKIIGSYLSKYDDYHKALMCYNMGEDGAKALWEEGIYSSSYSREIVSTMSNYEDMNYGKQASTD